MGGHTPGPSMVPASFVVGPSAELPPSGGGAQVEQPQGEGLGTIPY